MENKYKNKIKIDLLKMTDHLDWIKNTLIMQLV